MATKRMKRRTRRRSCKHGKLKRPVRTKKGGRRRCKKSKKRSRRKFRMDYQGPRGGCPPGMVEDIKNCGYDTPCKDQNGICKTKRGKRLSEVMSLQELATRRLLKSNPQEPVFTLNYNLPKHPPLVTKGYYLTSPIYPSTKFDIRSNKTIHDMEERDRLIELTNYLSLTVRKGYTEFIESLIKAGANVNSTNNVGMTPLMEASSFGHTEIARILIENGADLNARSKYGGYTALQYASRHGHRDIVKLLIEEDEARIALSKS